MVIGLIVGALVSTGYPWAVGLTVLLPYLVFRQTTRRDATLAALGYFAAALWPMIPCAARLHLPGPLLWLAAMGLLAIPYAALWSRTQSWWRPSVAVVLHAVPPFGVIGYVSPFAAAGLLFPGMGAVGLAFVLLATLRHYRILVGLALIAIASNAVCRPPELPISWRGVTTYLGDTSRAEVQYQAALLLRKTAETAKNDEVIVLPEDLLAEWHDGSAEWWADTVRELRSKNATILVGAKLIRRTTFDFSAELAALKGSSTNHSITEAAYDNAVIAIGASPATALQRIPVPIAMWRPGSESGARLHVADPAQIEVGGRRAVVLICHEQLIAWPALLAAVSSPDLLIAVSNDYWIASTTIPRAKTAAVLSLSRLFGIPVVSVSNLPSDTVQSK